MTMFKYRAPNSIEDCLVQACAAIGTDEVAHSIGTTPDMVRKYSNPECPQRLYADQVKPIEDATYTQSGRAPFTEMFCRAHEARERANPVELTVTGLHDFLTDTLKESGEFHESLSRYVGSSTLADASALLKEADDVLNKLHEIREFIAEHHGGNVQAMRAAQ